MIRCDSNRLVRNLKTAAQIVAAASAVLERARRGYDPGFRRDRRHAPDRDRYPSGVGPGVQAAAYSASRRMRVTIEARPLDRCAESAPARPRVSNARLASKAR